VAPAEPVRPAGDREQALYDLVEAKFGNNAEFFRRVAKLTKKKPATEKSSYYRIIRGNPGRRHLWRLGHYAKVLGISAETFLAAWEEDEAAADETSLPLNLSPREVRDALLKLIDQVDRLAGQVERLEQQQPSKSRRAVKR
jgi:hypothetical protein